MGTKKSKIAALLAYAFAAPVFAVSSSPVLAQDSVESRAVVIAPLGIANTSPLEFGTIIPSNANGIVEVDANTGNRTSNAGIVLVKGDGSAAQFWTYGGPRQYIYVTRGPYPILRREGGSETMRVDRLSLNGPVNRYLNGEGFLDLRVGGRLRVNANQRPGRYTGTFEITVTYY